MALLYYTNTKSLFSGAILRNLGNANTAAYGPFTLGVTVYSGAAPTAAAVAASWATYNSTNSIFLAHFTNMTWSQPGQGTLLQMTGAPTPVTPINNGTASWAIIWAGQPTGPQLASSTLPFTKFLLVSVSDAVGDGVIRFSSTAFTIAGGPVSVLDASMASFI
jgi:hypothetical protein